MSVTRNSKLPFQVLAVGWLVSDVLSVALGLYPSGQPGRSKTARLVVCLVNNKDLKWILLLLFFLSVSEERTVKDKETRY